MNNYSYNELAKFIKSGRSKIERKVENNTTARFKGGETDEKDNIIVRLHETDIATITHSTMILNSGGYKTQTTKDRLNKIIYYPLRIIQEEGIWFIATGYNDLFKTPFRDNILIYENNGSPYIRELRSDNTNLLHDIKLRKAIKKYAKGFITALVSGEVYKPDNGDCWYCLMRCTHNNVPLGEETNNIDHLESHIDENYFVPSLFYRACEVYPMCNFANGTIYQLWYTKDKISDWQKDILQRDGYKSLVKYLYMQFGLPY